ncbi:hypothetical protein J120_02420 [candidate division TM6 bacterium JCVI TM6SC1]|uniref:Uncharacterized protein n=1 Tax=candidate division TM6 bacterium JCVI TM6SC1 TaxID=1306947 RepID=A0A0D2JLF4_9BACT|nr:hypothetical protein J120_02420 [candidate division TM6 bacterium JCVI TM6SC1]
MNRFLLLLVVVYPAMAMQKEYQLTKALSFHKAVVRSRESLGMIELLKNENNFYVIKDGSIKLINKYDIDPLLKNMNEEKLQKYFEQNGYIQVDQLSNQDYVLKAKSRILGGGLGGATAGMYIGKWGTYIIGHGAIVVASALTGPGFLATFASLEAQFLPVIEAASNTAAVGMGIAVAVATGPV